jgi:CxxC motif-containing protein (DUF1111 family)
VYAYGDQIQNRAIPWAQPEACSTLQTICDDLVNGGDPELPDKQINLVIHYFQFLAVPSRRDTSLPEVKSGYQIFFERGCAGCCLPSLRTRADAFHPLFMD